VVLGIPDARLPHLQDGLQFLEENNYHAIIRNSGGLAVLLNEGGLNMSLIIPNDNQVSIHNGYDMMLAIVQQLFAPYTEKIEAYEIVGSYCPGDYEDRKSTRLNSSHVSISYAVFCLKKKI